MKKVYLLFSLIAVFALITVSCDRNDEISESIQNKSDNVKEKCTTIQSGELVDSAGNIIEVGYDQWGYNYQAQMFNGYYCDSYRDAAWCQPYADVELSMKWNDGWMSNQDCDGDGKLDRHNGFPTYRGSGAWLTNHQKGTYLDGEGNMCEWDYFVKIVAAPVDATVVEGNWVNADGTVIGPVTWGQFATIQVVENDPCAGIEGLQFQSPDHSGLGNW